MQHRAKAYKLGDELRRVLYIEAAATRSFLYDSKLHLTFELDILCHDVGHLALKIGVSLS